MSSAPPSQGKLSAEMSNALGVKLDEHVHYKPNMQMLSGKSHTGSSVYSVLTDNSGRHQDQGGYHPNNAEQQSGYPPPSLFSRHHSESIPSGNLRIDENAHTFSNLHSANQNSTGGSSNMSGAFNASNNRVVPPPQIFSAPLNGANLMSSNEKIYENQLVEGSQTQRKSHTNIHATANPNYGYTSNSYGHAHPGSHSYSQHQVSYSQTNSYSQSSSGIQYAPTSSAYQTSSNEHLVSMDGQQNSSNQPTYVLLQAPSEGSETGNQPQVFLAMQTGGMSGQENQSSPYITLQPVSVDGSELSASNTIGQEGMTLQQGVMGPSNSDMSNENKQIGSTESGQQVVLSLPGQQSLLQSGNSNGQNLVTYLQPLNSIGGNMEQGQVIMASSDLQGNLTLLGNSLSTGNKRTVVQQQSRQSSQVGLTTPRRRLSQDPRSCDQCGRSFKYPSDLKKHLQIHTDIKKFACDDCPRTFRRLHQLNVHRRIHTGEKPYACSRCGAQFRHDSTLTMHIRTRHDHLKPFSCEGCGKKFGRMSHLRKHQRNVCGRGNVRGSLSVCKYCETTFTKKSDLKIHLNECDKKPDPIEKEILASVTYICDTCGKSFSRVYDFKRHQLSHTEDKPYGCPQCGKTFKERTSLNKHVKRMHCAEGDGTIPIDDVDIIGCDDDEDEDEMSGGEGGSLSIVGSVSGHTTTATVTAQALAQAGIITSADGTMMTASGQTISATEILNFPEVAEALGINSGAHATVLHTNGNSTMIAITQPGNLETSEVSMDIDQNMLQDDNTTVDSPHYIPSSESLHITPVGHVDTDEMYTSSDHNVQVLYTTASDDVYRTGETSLDSSMVFKQDPDEKYTTHEDDHVSDHVKAEQAAAHDLEPHHHHTDNQLTENQINENHINENHIQDNQLTVSHLHDGQLIESHLHESQLTDNQLTEEQVHENQLAENQFSEIQMAENQLHASQLTESQIHEAQLHDSQLLQAQLHEAPLDEDQKHENQSQGAQIHEDQLQDPQLTEQGDHLAEHLPRTSEQSVHLEEHLPHTSEQGVNLEQHLPRTSEEEGADAAAAIRLDEESHQASDPNVLIISEANIIEH